jgi:hypothetical protein
VNAVKKNLDNIFFRIKKSWFARTYNIKSPLDFLRFSIDHKSSPTYLFTNGQTFLSLVVREPQRFEVVSHPISMSHPYNELHELIDPETAGCFASYSAAETAIRRRLSVLKFEVVPLGDGNRVETMLLQPAGNAWKNGDYVNTYIAWVRGETHVLRTSRNMRDVRTLQVFWRQLRHEWRLGWTLHEAPEFTGKVRSGDQTR